MRKFFSEPVRFIKESNTMESAFEKPYLDDNYNRMHLRWNIPDWHFGFDPRGGASRDEPLATCVSAKSAFCQVQCSYVNDTTTRCQLVGGYSTGATGLDISVFGGAPGEQSEGGPDQGGFYNAPSVDIIHESRDTCQEDFEVGAVFSWLETMCSKNYPKECIGSLPISCNPCADMADPEFANASTSLAPSSNVLISLVSSTLGPYTWNATGTGLTFTGGVTQIETSGASVTVYSNANFCNGKVTVEDACGGTADHYVRYGYGKRPADPTWDLADSSYIYHNDGTCDHWLHVIGLFTTQAEAAASLEAYCGGDPPDWVCSATARIYDGNNAYELRDIGGLSDGVAPSYTYLQVYKNHETPTGDYNIWHAVFPTYSGDECTTWSPVDT